MVILFDLQEELEHISIGAFDKLEYIFSEGTPTPALAVEEYDEVKFISITERRNNEAGISIKLPAISSSLHVGDRITITGRVGRGARRTNWGVALCANLPNTSEAIQLVQQIAPSELFSLTHILEETEVNATLTLRTMQWSESYSLMDVFVDSILITRSKESDTFKEDPRDIVYSLENDDYIQWVGMGEGHTFETSQYVQRSGRPTLTVFRHKNTNAIHVGNRSRDFDGLDIRLERLDLVKGNEYHVQVKGVIDGFAPEGTQIMLQGIPHFSWRDNQVVTSNQPFKLNHILRRSALEKWIMLRITTNFYGANVPFIIHSIEIRKVVT